MMVTPWKISSMATGVHLTRTRPSGLLLIRASPIAMRLSTTGLILSLTSSSSIPITRSRCSSTITISMRLVGHVLISISPWFASMVVFLSRIITPQVQKRQLCHAPVLMTSSTSSSRSVMTSRIRLSKTMPVNRIRFFQRQKPVVPTSMQFLP